MSHAEMKAALANPDLFKIIASALDGIVDLSVVDVGAHWGEETPFFESLARGRFTHIMIEPDPSNCEIIRADYPSKKLIQGAVSDSGGMKPFWFSFEPTTTHRGSGSLLEPTGHLKVYPTTSFYGPGIVQCYTLDEVYEKEDLTKVDLLWTDIQGGEMQMLRGGRRALTETRYLFMEVSDEELYRGQSLRADLLSELKGWEVVNEFYGNILMKNKDVI